jgi:hypothetical protein
MKLAIVVCSILPLVAIQVFAQGFVNGDFESGRGSGWTEYSSGGYTLIGTGPFFASNEIQPPVTPRSGSWMGRLGGYSYEVDSLTQTVMLPNTAPLYLSFWVQTRSANTSECGGLFVGALVSVSVNGILISSSYLCQYNDLYSWTNYFIDVSAIKGQSATLVFKAQAANSVWSYIYFDDISLTSTMDVRPGASGIPGQFKVEQNYPNPLNPSTVIRYQIPVASYVTLKVYNMLGEEVATLVNGMQEAGYKSAEWDASNLPSGIYTYRLTAGTFVEVKKMLMIK